MSEEEEFDAAYHHPTEISTAEGDVYCRTEGSGEFLQLVFRKAADVQDPEVNNWAGPFRAGDTVTARFDITLT